MTRATVELLKELIRGDQMARATGDARFRRVEIGQAFGQPGWSRRTAEMLHAAGLVDLVGDDDHPRRTWAVLATLYHNE